MTGNVKKTSPFMDLVKRSGEDKFPRKILLYGGNNSGKTYLSSQAPNVFFINTQGEDGLKAVDVNYLTVTSFEGIKRLIAKLRDEEHPFTTIVVDSMTALERILIDDCLKETGLQTLADSYGKAGGVLLNKFKDLHMLLSDLQSKKDVDLILICGEIAEKKSDVENPKLMPNLREKVARRFLDWCDTVGQLYFGEEGTRMIRVSPVKNIAVCKSRVQLNLIDDSDSIENSYFNLTTEKEGEK